MKINLHTGTLEILDSIKFHPGMTREDLFKQRKDWEDWIIIDDQKLAYRIIIDLTSNGEKINLVIIVFFDQNDGPINQLNFSPSEKFNGPQNKTEGKYTNIARIFFKKHFNLSLPHNNTWGNIDASYDPHNFYAEIICTYN